MYRLGHVAKQFSHRVRRESRWQCGPLRSRRFSAAGAALFDQPRQLAALSLRNRGLERVELFVQRSDAAAVIDLERVQLRSRVRHGGAALAEPPLEIRRTRSQRVGILLVGLAGADERRHLKMIADDPEWPRDRSDPIRRWGGLRAIHGR